MIAYPGELDWTHQLDVKLWYSNGKNTACQTVTAFTSSTSTGELPLMSRDVSAAAYAETGYEGHNQSELRATSDEEVLEFIAIAAEPPSASF
ncbi:MAG TPA: hypothetical protein VK978_03670 [Candidatus Saccharimonadales bacterium]|nr:hypothetical protein [Candidatus Saccharimonadales bacterium]